jgi:hypothetical protein
VSALEVRLVEVGGRLDHPEGDDLVARVRPRLGAAPVARRRRRRLVVAAIATLTAVLAVGALPSSRDAIAGFLRTDGGPLRSAHHHGATSAPPSTSTPAAAAGGRMTVAAAQRSVAFPIAVAASGVTPVVTVDPVVPGGLVTLDYPDFRITELAAPPGEAPLAKFVDPRTKVMPTTVRSERGYWITGTHHELAFLDRNDQVRTSTVHTTGHVLLWNERGVTIRIEGPHTLGVAQTIAESLD